MGLIYGPFAGITGHFDMLGMLDQDLCTEILKIAKEMRKWPGNVRWAFGFDFCDWPWHSKYHKLRCHIVVWVWFLEKGTPDRCGEMTGDFGMLGLPYKGLSAKNVRPSWGNDRSLWHARHARPRFVSKKNLLRKFKENCWGNSSSIFLSSILNYMDPMIWDCHNQSTVSQLTNPNFP